MFVRNRVGSVLFKIGLLYGLLIAGSYLLYRLLGDEAYDIFFQVANLGLLVAVGLYLFRKRGVPVIKQQIEEQQEGVQKLRNQIDVWNSKRHIIDRELDTERLETARLTDKVQQWHDAFNKYCQEREAEKGRLRAVLREKREVQSYYVTLEKARREVFSKSIDSARERLQEQFMADQKGEQFLTTIFEQMAAQERNV